jgi:hypothetical protein
MVKVVLSPFLKQNDTKIYILRCLALLGLLGSGSVPGSCVLVRRGSDDPPDEQAENFLACVFALVGRDRPHHFLKIKKIIQPFCASDAFRASCL